MVLTDRPRLAFNIMVTGLLLGVLGDALLRVGPWGLNALVWTSWFVGAAVGLAVWHHLPLARSALALAALALLYAAGLLWRDSETLKLLDLGALSLLLAFAAWQARGTRWLAGGVLDHAGRLARAGFDALGGYVPLFLGEALWPHPRADGWERQARGVLIGVVLALPPLIIFGALLMSADAVFHQFVGRVVDIDLSQLVSHLIPIAVCSWITGGCLVGLLFKDRARDTDAAVPQFASLGALEAGVVVGLLDLLFLSFIIVQVRYLFGGASLVEITPGLTYAEYARQGFFQLVTVAALALPLLLGADWLPGATDKRWFRALAAVMLLMLLLILASALHRLRLYQGEYGWTELRFYVLAFMSWLAVVLGWFGATVLPGRRERFTAGAVAAGLVGVLVLNFWNPDAWIAEKNLEHARAGHRLDAAYVARLSGDAVPVLVRALPQLSDEDRQTVRRRLHRWAKADTRDWRVWSWSRAAARTALARALPSVAAQAPAPHRKLL